MNVVKQLVLDVQERIYKPKFNPVSIVRSMDRKYHEINRSSKCWVRAIDLPAGTFSDVIKSYALPSDFVKLYNIVPADTSTSTLTPIPKERWNPNQYSNSNVFTIANGSLVFGNVSALSAFTLYIYSTGKTLVDAEDALIAVPAPTGGYLSTNYTNTPEWPVDFHSLLIWETCMDVSADYPFRNQDFKSADDMRLELKHSIRNNQSVGPLRIGGEGGYSGRARDPDYVDGLWVTRY